MRSVAIGAAATALMASTGAHAQIFTTATNIHCDGVCRIDRYHGSLCVGAVAACLVHDVGQWRKPPGCPFAAVRVDRGST
jgi:hypothetical protein